MYCSRESFIWNKELSGNLIARFFFHTGLKKYGEIKCVPSVTQYRTFGSKLHCFKYLPNDFAEANLFDLWQTDKQADITQQLHTELGIHMSILIQGSQHQPISPVALRQLYVLPHHLHLLVWVQEVAPTRTDHDVDWNFYVLLDNLQQPCAK